MLDVFGSRVVASPVSPPPALADRALVISAAEQTPDPPPQEVITAEELTPQLAGFRLEWLGRRPLPASDGRSSFDRVWGTIEPFLGDDGSARVYAAAMLPQIGVWPPEKAALLTALLEASHSGAAWVTLQQLAREVERELEADGLGNVTPREISTIMRTEWQLHAKRSGPGYRLEIDAITRERIHVLAAGSDLPATEGCKLCARYQPARPGPAKASPVLASDEQCSVGA